MRRFYCDVFNTCDASSLYFVFVRNLILTSGVWAAHFVPTLWHFLDSLPLALSSLITPCSGGRLGNSLSRFVGNLFSTTIWHFPWLLEKHYPPTHTHSHTRAHTRAHVDVDWMFLSKGLNQLCWSSARAAALTLMVSSGCPASSRHAPPTPPATKFLNGDSLGFSSIPLTPHGPSTQPGNLTTSHRCCPGRGGCDCQLSVCGSVCVCVSVSV